MEGGKISKDPKFIDITNHTYGNLFVDSFSHRKKYKTYWNCTCKCGNKRIVQKSYLRSNIVTCCHKCGKEKGKPKIIRPCFPKNYDGWIEKILGIKPTSNRKWQRQWVCRCLCGALTTAYTHEINSGEKLSCGCMDRVRRNSPNTIRKGKKIIKIQIPGEKKTCRKCKKEYPCTTEYFWRYQEAKDGLQYNCKNCQNLRNRISVPIKKSLSGENVSKKFDKILRSLGYTLEDLKEHLESTFTEGMTWDNFNNGEIHIDHIIPYSAFAYKSFEDKEFKKCWSLDNLRCLWASDNISKHNKLELRG